MTTDYDYMYKKLDEAYLGHEEAKQWVLSNVGEVLGLVDAMLNEKTSLHSRIAALEEELEDNESDINYYEDEIARLQHEIDLCEQEEHRLNRTILDLEARLQA